MKIDIIGGILIICGIFILIYFFYKRFLRKENSEGKK
jgi:membrane-associated phospholipid phosphatase